MARTSTARSPGSVALAVGAPPVLLSAELTVGPARPRRCTRPASRRATTRVSGDGEAPLLSRGYRRVHRDGLQIHGLWEIYSFDDSRQEVRARTPHSHARRRSRSQRRHHELAWAARARSRPPPTTPGGSEGSPSRTALPLRGRPLRVQRASSCPSRHTQRYLLGVSWGGHHTYHNGAVKGIVWW